MLKRVISSFIEKQKQKKNDRAELIFNKAIKLSEWGAYEASIPLYFEVLKHAKNHDAVHFKLAEDYRLSGRNDKAICHYRECLKINPADPFGVSIKLYLLGAMDQLEPLPPLYVKTLFDQYAPYYDDNLAVRFKCAVPQSAYALMSKHQERFDTILDLGCGTGLSALPYKKIHANIHGVDVSEAMLSEARAKDIYTDLFCADAYQYLTDCAESYDLILALDLFMYLGNITDLIDLIRAKITKAGYLVFSIQTTSNGYVLGEDHRYAHSHDYTRSALSHGGFDIVEVQDLIVRKEEDTAVPGAIYICKPNG